MTGQQIVRNRDWWIALQTSSVIIHSNAHRVHKLFWRLIKCIRFKIVFFENYTIKFINKCLKSEVYIFLFFSVIGAYYLFKFLCWCICFSSRRYCQNNYWSLHTYPPHTPSSSNILTSGLSTRGSWSRVWSGLFFYIRCICTWLLT